MQLYYLPEAQEIDFEPLNLFGLLPANIPYEEELTYIRQWSDTEKILTKYGSDQDTSSVIGQIRIEWRQFLGFSEDVLEEQYTFFDDYISVDETADHLIYINTQFIEALPLMQHIYATFVKNLLQTYGGLVSLDNQKTWLSVSEFTQDIAVALDESIDMLADKSIQKIEQLFWVDEEEVTNPEINPFYFSEEWEPQWLPRPTI